MGPIHGKYSTYVNWKCRCDECREASTKYHREGRLAAEERFRNRISDDDPGHGTASFYKRGCKCSACKKAGNEARYKRRAAAIEKWQKGGQSD